MMRRKISWGILTALLVLCLAAMGQTPAPPLTGDPVLDALTKYQTDAGADGGNLITNLIAWKAAREKAESDLQKATAGLVQDEANIKTLQGQVAALMNPTPAPPVSPLLYMLAVSPNVNYSGATPLDSGTIKGNVYIFTAPFNNPGNPNPTGAAMVNYTLDAIACPNVERNSPYDFMGGGAAGFWNTTLDCLGKPMANGKHIITQVVTFTSGGTETDRAAFTVAN